MEKRNRQTTACSLFFSLLLKGRGDGTQDPSGFTTIQLREGKKFTNRLPLWHPRNDHRLKEGRRGAPVIAVEGGVKSRPLPPAGISPGTTQAPVSTTRGRGGLTVVGDVVVPGCWGRSSSHMGGATLGRDVSGRSGRDGRDRAKGRGVSAAQPALEGQGKGQLHPPLWLRLCFVLLR